VSSSPQYTPPPTPPSERHAWLLACVTGLVGVVVLVLVLTGVVGSTPSASPPAVRAVAATPKAGVTSAASALAGARAKESTSAGVATGAAVEGAGGAHGAIVAQPTPEQQSIEARRLVDATEVHISRRWMEGFYPIYETAQSTFGVNWLLIASIHRQESAFSTAPGTYEGLNFAHCCGGPMQFNVTNGPVSTWDLVSDSYIYGKRPASYDHMTATHPSIYDDFDAIMAAAHLLSADGAEDALDGAAWDAAYDYYGHDATGVSYADEVLARAIGWSQHGFCINCGVEPALVEAVQAAYGVPVLTALEAEAKAEAEVALTPAKARSAKHRSG
jgi:hypothetical protein